MFSEPEPHIKYRISMLFIKVKQQSLASIQWI